MNSQRSLKVAFVATVYGHLEGFHLPYMQLLQDRGCEVHAYARPGRSKNKVEEKDIICHDIPFQRSPYQLDNLKALRGLVASFNKERYHMVHVHTPVAGILGRAAAGISRVPVVIYTAHGFHFFKGAPLVNRLLYYPLERAAARWTDYLITINQEDYCCASKFPVRKQVLYVPGVGMDTELYHLPDEDQVKRNTRMKLGVGEEDFLILCVAELNANKNHLQLIRAVKEMAALNKPVRCFLAGSGKGRQKTEDHIREHGMAGHVRLLGFRQDIPELMAAADVVTLLSKREGLPRVLMEAMAAGRPVVATDIRGSRDLVIPGETGFLVAVADIGATVDAFVKLCNEPALRLEMGRKNREMAAKYDLKSILCLMSKIYDQALAMVTFPETL